MPNTFKNSPLRSLAVDYIIKFLSQSFDQIFDLLDFCIFKPIFCVFTAKDLIFFDIIFGKILP